MSANLCSLLSVVAMALAFACAKPHLEKLANLTFALQIAGYLLMAWSSRLMGVNAAAIVFVMCAVTLLLKTLRAYSAPVMAFCWVGTLAGGLLVNDRGWLAALPLLAGLGVIYRHTYRRRIYLPKMLFPRDMWKELRRYSILDYPRMDNANRLPSHALDLFMENIVGVILWGVYARLTGDRAMFLWRCAMLAINAADYIRRFARALPDLREDVYRRNRARRGKRSPGRRINWTI